MTSQVAIAGIGAVSPAGWGIGPLWAAIEHGAPPAAVPIDRPGGVKGRVIRPVPPPPNTPLPSRHPRLRRASPIARFTVAAALEALEGIPTSQDRGRLGIVCCTLCGSIRYTSRFYDEVLRDPPSASPLIFPETVFNAPTSHLAAVLETRFQSTTLLGDPGVVLLGLNLAADWLLSDQVDTCLVVAAEELDWTVTEAHALFFPREILGEGAAALALTRAGTVPALARLEQITSPWLYRRDRDPGAAAAAMRAELPSGKTGSLLVQSRPGGVAGPATSNVWPRASGLSRGPTLECAEGNAWSGWEGRRMAPAAILGESFAASAGWQCVLGVGALARGLASDAFVSIVGCNQQAIGARFAAWG